MFRSHCFSIYYNSRLLLKLPIIDMELTATRRWHLLDGKSTLLLQSFPIRHTFQKMPGRKKIELLMIFCRAGHIKLATSVIRYIFLGLPIWPYEHRKRVESKLRWGPAEQRTIAKEVWQSPQSHYHHETPSS